MIRRLIVCGESGGLLFFAETQSGTTTKATDVQLYLTEGSLGKLQLNTRLIVSSVYVKRG